jgi:hypothetical protein
MYNSNFIWSTVQNAISHSKGRTKTKVFENKLLRRIFEPKRGKVTGTEEKGTISSS